VLRPVSAILDTGAGPNLIREKVLPDDWERYRIPGPPEFHIVGAGGRRLLQKDNITLTVQLGTIKVQARFIVVESLAAECILGCQFIDRQVQAIHPKEKRVTLSNGSVIPIIHDSGAPVCARQPPPPKELPPSTKVRVSKMIVLPPRSECVVPVQCTAPGYVSCRHGSVIMPHGCTWRTASPKSGQTSPSTFGYSILRRSLTGSRMGWSSATPCLIRHR
jgi:Retroviral aspartyl protease